SLVPLRLRLFPCTTLFRSGMRVVAFDPYVPADAFARAGVDPVDFAELLKTSDYVSIHAPLLPETRGLFNAEAFEQMKRSAYLIRSEEHTSELQSPDHLVCR